MAKKDKENSQNIEEKKSGIFSKLFFLVIIPVLFIVAILLALATFTDFNVFEKVGGLFSKDNEQETSAPTNKDHEKEIVKLQAEIKEKEAEIEQLQSQVDKLSEEKQNSEIKQEQLQLEMEKMQQKKTEEKAKTTEIIRTYEQMSAKKAAPILAEMKEDEAINILSQLKPDTLSKVLAAMDPKKAATFTEKLSQIE